MQWIVLLIVVGASIVSWIIKKLQEEQERRRAREEAARHELERLRTGREPGEETESAAQMRRAQELQARRQQQLQELRRRQQERSRQQPSTVKTQEVRVGPGTATTTRGPGGGAASGQGRVWVPGSSGTTVPQRPPTRPAPQSRRIPTQQPAGPRPQPTPRPQPSKGPQQVSRTVPMREGRAQFPQAAPPPARPTAPTRPSRPAGPRPAVEVYRHREAGPSLLETIKPANSDEWRRAIIMHEILSPPIGMREQEQY